MTTRTDMTIEIFKKITTGGIPRDQLLQRLAEAGIQHNEYARVLFNDAHFTISEPHQVCLSVVSVKKLGLNNGGTSSEIFAAASRQGLALCPLELAAHFRLQYMDQPEGPYLTVASAKTRDDEEYPNGFYLRRLNGILWLRGYRATSDYIWEPASVFAFLTNEQAVSDCKR
ncbi:MAG: hypothetical protein A2W80_04330 [Candidatus Riflebacteria bacterium GWC2_50_8]|nr:MAG: hypothetical protein A2W80_04330 [Candidatus Riflebacteria bacterium GWC2_50_8]